MVSVFLWERTRLVNNERRLLGGLEFLDGEQFSQTPKTVYIFIRFALLPSVLAIVFSVLPRGCLVLVSRCVKACD